jgi:hypothetical protein
MSSVNLTLTYSESDSSTFVHSLPITLKLDVPLQIKYRTLQTFIESIPKVTLLLLLLTVSVVEWSDSLATDPEVWVRFQALPIL